MVHEERSALFRLFRNSFLGLALGADKQNSFALPGKIAHEAARFAEHLQGFLQVNNVNPVALAKNIFLHLWIPAPRLVTEVNSGLQQLFHCNFYCHYSSLLNSCLPGLRSGGFPPLAFLTQNSLLPASCRP